MKITEQAEIPQFIDCPFCDESKFSCYYCCNTRRFDTQKLIELSLAVLKSDLVIPYIEKANQTNVDFAWLCGCGDVLDFDDKFWFEYGCCINCHAAQDDGL